MSKASAVSFFRAMTDQYMREGNGFLVVVAVNDKNAIEQMRKYREKILRVKDTFRVPIVGEWRISA